MPVTIRGSMLAQMKLRAVLEITRNLGQSLAVDVFLKSILDTLFQIFPQAARGYILLAEPDGRLKPRAVKLDRGDGNESLTLGPISQSVAQRVMTEGKAILSTDAKPGDADRDASVLEDPVSSMISAPLMGPSQKPLGLIHIDTSDPIRQFSAEDLDVLASAAAVAGHAVEHARLHETAMKLDRREREMAMAHHVQLHFLPQQPPDLPGYRFFSFYRAAEDVGGDYFGYIPMADGRLAIALADVSGKGVSAALLMARLCAEVRYCLAVTQTPVEAIARLNREFSGPALGDMFITFLMGVLDPRDNTLTLVNAGPHAAARSPAEIGSRRAAGGRRIGTAAGLRSGSGLRGLLGRARAGRRDRDVYRRNQRGHESERLVLRHERRGKAIGPRRARRGNLGPPAIVRRRAIHARQPTKRRHLLPLLRPR